MDNVTQLDDYDDEFRKETRLMRRLKADVQALSMDHTVDHRDHAYKDIEATLERLRESTRHQIERKKLAGPRVVTLSSSAAIEKDGEAPAEEAPQPTPTTTTTGPYYLANLKSANLLSQPVENGQNPLNPGKSPRDRSPREQLSPPPSVTSSSGKSGRERSRSPRASSERSRDSGKSPRESGGKSPRESGGKSPRESGGKSPRESRSPRDALLAHNLSALSHSASSGKSPRESGNKSPRTPRAACSDPTPSSPTQQPAKTAPQPGAKLPLTDNVIQRPKTSYVYFVEEKSAEYRKSESNNNMHPSDLLKLIGAQWKAISNDERKKYYELELDDDRRYTLELQHAHQIRVSQDNISSTEYSEYDEFGVEYVI